MQRAQRLRQRRELAAVYRRGRSYRGELLVLRVLRTERSVSRFALSAGRALGKAVVRNRVKRRLREAVWSLPVAPGWDIIVNARPVGAGADYQRLRRAVGGLMAKAGVLESREADGA